jgi:hypothetical protein
MNHDSGCGDALASCVDESRPDDVSRFSHGPPCADAYLSDGDNVDEADAQEEAPACSHGTCEGADPARDCGGDATRGDHGTRRNHPPPPPPPPPPYEIACPVEAESAPAAILHEAFGVDASPAEGVTLPDRPRDKLQEATAPAALPADPVSENGEDGDASTDGDFVLDVSVFSDSLAPTPDAMTTTTTEVSAQKEAVIETAPPPEPDQRTEAAAEHEGAPESPTPTADETNDDKKDEKVEDGRESAAQTPDKPIETPSSSYASWLTWLWWGPKPTDGSCGGKPRPQAPGIALTPAELAAVKLRPASARGPRPQPPTEPNGVLGQLLSLFRTSAGPDTGIAVERGVDSSRPPSVRELIAAMEGVPSVLASP